MNHLIERTWEDSNSHTKRPNYSGRRIGAVVAALAVSVGAFNIGGAAVREVKSIMSPVATAALKPSPDNKNYTVQSGDTPWGIASKEGPNVANNPEKLYEAEQQIMIENHGSATLQVGKNLQLPPDSKIGHTKS